MSVAPRRHSLGLLAALVLLAGWSASADAISGVRFSPGGSITQTGTLSVESGVACPVTISGSFATTLVSIGEGETPVVGSVTGLSSGTCTRGSIRAILNLPAALRMISPNRTVPAGAVSTMNLMTNMGIRVLLSTGTECLAGSINWLPFLEALGNNEYTLGRSFNFPAACGFGTMTLELTAPSPTQVATFLPGNEVIDGFTPRPVVFRTVSPGELSRQTVTIGSAAGGRIEEIVVTSQRYFAITDPNGCRGRTLEARGTCNINVILSAPAESGRSVSDTLTVRIAERRFEGTLRAST